MPNTEDIEAKLCAYVDGELDEAGRGEIERHLTTNPQHRTLIDELAQQRDFLRALPRARAPVDVAETLNAQLERSALLSEDDWRDRPIRISHWPQIRAAAAVLLLVFGLAAVVYYVVPSPNQQNPNIAFNAPAVDTVSPTGVPTTSPVTDVFTGRGNPVPDVGRSAPQDRVLALLTTESMRDSVVNNALAPQLKMMREAFASSPPPRGEVTVVVAAADVDDARRHVQEFLDQRGVRLEPKVTEASAPESLSFDLSQQLPGAQRQRQRQAQVKMREEADEPRQESAFIPDLPGAGGVAPDVPEEQDKLDAPRADDAAANAEAVADQPADQTYFTRLPRRQVAELCRRISNEFAGRVARVVEETPATGQPAPEADSSTFPPVTIGDWSGLFPWLAKSESSPAAQERRLGFATPAREPDADEEVDVLIVVRPDAALQLQQQQRAIAHEPAAAPAAEDDAAAPTTAPATSPSSPQ